MKGLLSLTISWRLWFSRELTSSRQFQYSRLVVGGAIAQYLPWISFVAWQSRNHRFPNFKPTFFFNWIIIITHFLFYTHPIHCHVNWKHNFTISKFCQKKLCTECATIRCSLFLQLRIFTTCFILSMFTLSTY